MSKHPPVPEMLTGGPLELDMIRRRLLVSGRPVSKWLRPTATMGAS